MNLLDLQNLTILIPALVAGFLVLLSHVPLGQEVLRRGIIFIDLAIAQVVGLGVIASHTLGIEPEGWAAQFAAMTAALLGALLLTWTERKTPELQEALIGVLFVLAATAQILLLASDPHGSEDLKDLLAGQILWVSSEHLTRASVLTALFLIVWFRWREHLGRVGFYVAFALMVTVSVQLVGVYLVFTTLIVPAIATSRTTPKRRLVAGYAMSALGYLVGLGLSAVYDLPSGPVVVVTLAIFGIAAYAVMRPVAQIQATPAGAGTHHY
ncbi:MAG: metal ABC transporter permease [Steroidobacteraceae bacterium]